MTGYQKLLICLIIPFFTSCALSSGERIRRIAQNKHFTYHVERSNGFSHAIFSNNRQSSDSKELHIYLEGDGSPWQLRYLVSSDPTPVHPLMLDLMEKDFAAAIYVGRPCYNGFANEESCSPRLWTVARHSKIIIDSMAAVIKRISAQREADKLHLYGHSGGGAMAMLLAAQLADVEFVVTLAGNLDLSAWTNYHAYTPLYGSINPATQNTLDSSVEQLHLMGAKDRNIPTTLVLDWIKEQENTQYYIFDDYNHVCCWGSVWPSVLNYLNATSSQEKLGIQFPSGMGTFNLESSVDQP